MKENLLSKLLRETYIIAIWKPYFANLNHPPTCGKIITMIAYNIQLLPHSSNYYNYSYWKGTEC